MNNIEIFKNSEFGEIRTIIKDDNNVLFCLKDICKILDIGNVGDVKARLDSSDVDTVDVGVNTGFATQNFKMIFVNESGLYDCVLDSRKPNARKFRKWITSEVLPSIRKHGMYATEELINNPDLLIQVATKLKEEKEKNRLLENKIEEQKPKVRFYDTVTKSETHLNLEQVAKLLNYKGVGRNNLFKILREQDVLTMKNFPYQKYVDLEYFKLIEGNYIRKGQIEVYLQTVVSQKGIEFIDKLLSDLGYIKGEIEE